MPVDEAIRDLLSVSTDIRRLVLLRVDGTVTGAGPAAAGPEVAPALEALWRAAREAASGATPEYVVVDLGEAAVVALEAGSHRAVALTTPDPPVGLVLFDLRTCLADAFAGEDAAPADLVPTGTDGDGTRARAAADAGEAAEDRVGEAGAGEAGT